MFPEAMINSVLEVARGPVMPGAKTSTYLARVMHVNETELRAGGKTFDRATGLEIKHGRSFGFSDKIVRVIADFDKNN